MTTFDSTKLPLKDLLKDVVQGKIQLPDFQRGWRTCAQPAGQPGALVPGGCSDAAGNRRRGALPGPQT
ncbi:hypothetical protein [Xanthomonas vasicola]|uniref:hypothetical protein n=1 Tax=Xanthomonas vasicola TaxID=56459 RepID=UPI0010EA7ACC|nr:hypothetical protein [Xanthomonas vasicola]MDO6935351.1 hypothetical protein [Xanthomonas vasicola]MDO6939251.1 hypothetical protein [Xanthomonas vasicola]MDO6953628.1 hypothetical protein [Xanthomonas vasicola]MDO6985393.1 hypothetical protein [Xanthomonas vasicola]